VTASLHREADADLTNAFRHYKREAGTGVAGRFLKEFRRVTQILETDPGLGTRTGEGRRMFPLIGFPYSLIYREVDTGIRILVIRHQSRDPEYGEDRS
jgi:plasmid stabilization system protein ParE